jgi:ubiquinone/menaquinone biosynthesis C-methylase UbiE
MKNNLHLDRRFEKFDKRYFTTGGYDDYLIRYQKEGKEYANLIKQKLNPLPHWKFLDVGCGMGGLILALRKMGYDAMGTEVSPYVLKYSPAKRWMIKAEITDLPFEDRRFDVVTAFEVLYYLAKQEVDKAIGELCRVAKSYVIIDTIDKNSPNASQEHNPDELRKFKYLVPAEFLIKHFLIHRYTFLKKFLPLDQDPDFNGIFKRGN